MDWHYASEGRQFGPVAEEELQSLARRGVVKPDTLVWRSGMTAWQPFSDAGPCLPLCPPPAPVPAFARLAEAPSLPPIWPSSANPPSAPPASRPGSSGFARA